MLDAASVVRMRSAVSASPERRRLLANIGRMIRQLSDCRRLTVLSAVRALEGVAINRADAIHNEGGLHPPYACSEARHSSQAGQRCGAPPL